MPLLAACYGEVQGCFLPAFPLASHPYAPCILHLLTAARSVCPLPPTCSCVRQLSLDWHVLVQLPLTRLPPRCRQLALVGRDGAMRGMLCALASLPALLPDLQHLLLEPAALDALSEQSHEGAAGTPTVGSAGGANWQLVGGRWRPTRLPGQPRPAPAQRDVLQQLQAAQVQVAELLHPEQLAAVLDGLEGRPQAQAACAAGRQS